MRILIPYPPQLRLHVQLAINFASRSGFLPWLSTDPKSSLSGFPPFKKLGKIWCKKRKAKIVIFDCVSGAAVLENRCPFLVSLSSPLSLSVPPSFTLSLPLCTMALFPNSVHKFDLFQKLNIFDSLPQDRPQWVTLQIVMTPLVGTHEHSRNMELEKFVHKHVKIPISITQGVKKPISPHAVRFSSTINVFVRDTFPVWCLKFAMFHHNILRLLRTSYR
ncbi:(R)-mandelonitrile lyase 1-like [Cucumis melo var. makuwa]|uniref:(R)-mandelonitrile lyase 1-like n=1 Tax=Cucumis melo var. makuwa TaxID=1194695 RepID=A0A5A7UED9_CUCMM|nr:(R)-mandelonitrile lyase 1-like [Cucumis melo var. makuwa]